MQSRCATKARIDPRRAPLTRLHMRIPKLPWRGPADTVDGFA